LLIEGDLTIPQPDSELGGAYRFETALNITSETGIITEQRLIRKLRVSVMDAHSSTQLSRSNDAPGVVFEGSADELLKTVVNYHDLFNKDSYHYKYDYAQEVK